MSSFECTGYGGLTQKGGERRGDRSKETGMGGWKREENKRKKESIKERM